MAGALCCCLGTLLPLLSWASCVSSLYLSFLLREKETQPPGRTVFSRRACLSHALRAREWGTEGEEECFPGLGPWAG